MNTRNPLRPLLSAALAIALLGHAASAAERGSAWDGYLDYAYVYSSADSKALTERLTAYGNEAGISLAAIARFDVDIARLRLARVLFDEKNSADALKLLEIKPVDSFIGLYADLKGDVLAAQGKRAEARAAYQVAFDKSDAASPLQQILQLKLDATGESK